MKEAQVLRDVHLYLGQRDDVVVWRNTTGAGITVERKELELVANLLPGRPAEAAARMRRILAQARYVRHGLCPGSSDLIGFHVEQITPGMVGREVARFLAVELKNPTVRVASMEQRLFIDLVNKRGGRAGIARSVDDARNLLGQQKDSSGTK